MAENQARCPALEDPWEFECELPFKFFCPYAAFPIGMEAREKGLPECPYSGQGPELSGEMMVSQPA